MLAPARTYVHESLTSLRNFDIFTLFSPWRLVELMLNFAYVFLQVPLIVLFKPVSGTCLVPVLLFHGG